MYLEFDIRRLQNPGFIKGVKYRRSFGRTALRGCFFIWGGNLGSLSRSGLSCPSFVNPYPSALLLQQRNLLLSGEWTESNSGILRTTADLDKIHNLTPAFLVFPRTARWSVRPCLGEGWNTRKLWIETPSHIKAIKGAQDNVETSAAPWISVEQ